MQWPLSWFEPLRSMEIHDLIYENKIFTNHPIALCAAEDANSGYDFSLKFILLVNFSYLSMES